MQLHPQNQPMQPLRSISGGTFLAPAGTAYQSGPLNLVEISPTTWLFPNEWATKHAFPHALSYALI